MLSTRVNVPRERGWSSNMTMATRATHYIAVNTRMSYPYGLMPLDRSQIGASLEGRKRR